MASSLYHPDTVERSLRHDGHGAEPGIKDEEDRWDLRPHALRVFKVDSSVLRAWAEVIEAAPETPGVADRTRMVYAVNRSANDVLRKVAAQARRIGHLKVAYGLGWNETDATRDGTLAVDWGAPSTWSDVVLQGSHLFVANPFNKSPNCDAQESPGLVCGRY